METDSSGLYLGRDPGVRAYVNSILEENRRLQDLVLIDNVTQLFNSGMFIYDLGLEFERSRRYQRPLSLLMGAIDDLEAYTGRFGENDSRIVIQEVGRIVKRQVFTRDRAFRCADNRFAALLPEAPLEGVMKAAGRVADAVRRYNAPNTQVTMSFGISYRPYTGIRTQDDLVAKAEMALAYAQKSGRDRICTINDLPGL